MRLVCSRVGSDEVEVRNHSLKPLCFAHRPCQVRWSPGAVPPHGPWRLSLDVAPVLEPGETAASVMGDVFCAAAAHGLLVHTLPGRLLFDVTETEAAARCKRIPLLPRRTYHVALVRRPSSAAGLC